MSQAKKRIERLRSVPADFSWDELVVVLEDLGFKELTKKGGGSHRTFMDAQERKIVTAKPHPSPNVRRYLLRDVLKKLVEYGILNDE